MRVEDLGLMEYETALAGQHAAHAEVADGGQERLLLVEHPPVVTLGRRGGDVRGLDLPVVRTKRGGLATCHFPGQLVGYAVMRVPARPGGLRALVAGLEHIIIVTAAEFGVSAGRMDGRPGVWVRGRKVASLGLSVQRMTTMHGFALNVGPDVSLFKRIVPCGLQGVEITSLSREAGREIDINEVKSVVAKRFAEHFAHSQVV